MSPISGRTPSMGRRSTASRSRAPCSIHPNTIPFDIVKEKVDSTELEVTIDDDGLPHTGTWSLRGQARVGGGVGQLQRVLYELDLVFSKVGDDITIERP